MQAVIVKIASSILLAVCLAHQPLIANATAAKPPLRFAATGKGSVSVPPYIWYDECEQDSVGFVSSLLQRLSADLGYTPQRLLDQQPYRFDEIFAHRRSQLMSGAVDAVILLEGPSQDGLISSSEPVLEFDYRIILSSKLSGINTLKDLAPYNGALYSGNPAISRLWLQGLGLKAELVNTNVKSFELLVAGQVDYVIADRFMAKRLVHANSWQDKVVFTTISTGIQRAYFTVLEGGAHEHLITQVDRLLQEYRESGFIYHMKKQSLLMWFAKHECVVDVPSGVLKDKKDKQKDTLYDQTGSNSSISGTTRRL